MAYNHVRRICAAAQVPTLPHKVKAVVESAGGWAGATASAAAFAAWFAPGDAAGPWAWAATVWGP